MNFNIWLDFNKPFDDEKVNVLENAINILNGSSPNKAEIDNILVKLSNDNSFWISAPKLWEQNLSNQTRFFILKSLNNAIKFKWDIFDNGLKENMKNFILGYICYIVEQENIPSFIKNCSNNILLEIIKLEWCESMQNIIEDLINSSKNSMTLCENILNIIKQLSEDIFQFSKNSIDFNRINKLKGKFFQNIGSIFDLINYVLDICIRDNIVNNLLKVCIDTLTTLIFWCPFNLIFDNNLIQNKLFIFIEKKELIINVLKCLDSIINVDVNERLHNINFYDNEKKVYLDNLHIGKMYDILIIIVNELHKNIGGIDDVEFVRNNSSNNLNQINFLDIYIENSSLAISNLFKNHYSRIINDILNGDDNFQNNFFLTIKNFINLLNKILLISEDKIFKNCIEFLYNYFWMAENLCNHIKFNNNSQLNLGITKEQKILMRFYNIKEFLQNTVNILIFKMVKPNEIRIIVNDQNIPERELIENTENSLTYEQLKKIFIILAQIKWSDLKSILSEELESQLKDNFFSYNKINSISWTIGCLKDNILDVNDEKQFLVYTIRFLLYLNENKTEMSDKIIIATNIMYLVSQFKRFLVANYVFLITVINKLFEFISYKNEHIQEMVCNTYIKVIENCTKELSIKHVVKKGKENITYQPYVYQMIDSFPDLLNNLLYNYKFLFLEGCSKMLKNAIDYTNNEINHNNNLALKFLQYFDDIWIQSINGDLNNSNVIENLIFTLKSFITISEHLKYCFDDYFKKIYPQVLNLFVFSENVIKNSINNNVNFNSFIILKKYITILFNNQVINYRIKNDFDTLYFDLLNIILDSYKNLPNQFKDFEVIIWFSSVLNSLGDVLMNNIPYILDVILDYTLPLIKNNFEDFMDHRLNFFIFIKVLTQKHFNLFLKIPGEKIDLIINCILWSSKHSLPSIYETGLLNLYEILHNINNSGIINLINEFYNAFYLKLIQEIMSILFDQLHESHFTIQTKLFKLLLNTNFIISKNSLDQNMDNINYTYKYILDLMGNAFTNLSKNSHETYLNNIFSDLQNIDNFKENLRTYKIELKKYSN